MRRTTSTGIALMVLALAGCKGAAYQPYNGPDQAAAVEQSNQVKQPTPGTQPTPAKPSSPAPQPSPPEPAPDASNDVSIGDVAKKLKASIPLTSRSFANGGPIPSTFTCDGFDGSPDLAWSGIPSGTVELAVTMEDRKAPHGGFTHWTVFGLKPTLTGLAANQVPAGAMQGMNDFHQTGYGGPCPGYTDTTHHYVVTLYALKAATGLTDGAPPGDVRAQVDASAIAKGRLTGTYRRRS